MTDCVFIFTTIIASLSLIGWLKGCSWNETIDVSQGMLLDRTLKGVNHYETGFLGNVVKQVGIVPMIF